MLVHPTILCVWSLLTICFHTAGASHFLGGTITWKTNAFNSTHVSITVAQTYSWTYVVGRCDGTSIATNAAVAGSGGSFLVCSPACPVGFTTISTLVYCTDVSSLNGIAVGQSLITTSIAIGSDFLASYTGSAWGTLTSGGPTWSISTNIDVNLRGDTGQPNNAPVATIMSPINVNPSRVQMIKIPTQDVDGDDVRCRWAGSTGITSECGSICPPTALPPSITLYQNCTVQVVGPPSGQTYAIAVIVSFIL